MHSSLKGVETVILIRAFDKNTSTILQFKRRLLVGIGLLTISFCIVCSLSLFHDAYADDKSIKMTEQRTFKDSNGNLNVIGVVDNNGKVPVGITVALNTTGKDTAATTTIATIKQSTYGRIIYPSTGAPL